MTTPPASSPAELTSELTAFFRQYGEHSLHGEPAAIATSYAPTFLVGGPAGSAAFANDEKFLQWLGQLRTFNDQAGMTAMSPAGVRATALSPIHALAQVTWSARFARTGDREITFEIAYLVERAGDSWKVLGYVSEADQEAEMKKLGLL
jgi:hypothetical protein